MSTACQTTPRQGRPWPAITAGLLTAALSSYALFPATSLESATWLPLEALGLKNLLWVTAAGVLRHPDAFHFGVNWVLLAYFGILLEWRLGSGRVLTTVVLGSVLASLVSLNLMLAGGEGGAAPVHGIRHAPVGISGAVAGLMGLFSVQGRCARRPRLRSCQPLWIGGMLLTAAYMLQDFAAGATTVTGIAGTVDYWSHLGAFGGGMAVAAVAAAEDADRGSGRGVPASVMNCS